MNWESWWRPNWSSFLNRGNFARSSSNGRNPMTNWPIQPASSDKWKAPQLPTNSYHSPYVLTHTSRRLRLSSLCAYYFFARKSFGEPGWTRQSRRHFEWQKTVNFSTHWRTQTLCYWETPAWHPQSLREQFTILKKYRGKFECLISEMLFIQEKKPELNTQSDSIKAKLFST